MFLSCVFTRKGTRISFTFHPLSFLHDRRLGGGIVHTFSQLHHAKLCVRSLNARSFAWIMWILVAESATCLEWTLTHNQLLAPNSVRLGRNELEGFVTCVRYVRGLLLTLITHAIPAHPLTGRIHATQRVTYFLVC